MALQFAMDQQSLTIESLLAQTLDEFIEKLANRDDDSSWWKCVYILFLLFGFLLGLLLVFILTPILVCARLAIAHADRVVFVLASAILSFYQVPKKVFYIYMAVLAFTGFLQFLRYKSFVRYLFLRILSLISCGTSNMFLRKFTTLHFSNPFNRCYTLSEVVYVPIGFEIPGFRHIEIVDFPILEDLNFDKIVGCCRIKIETLNNMTNSSTIIRILSLDAPWGNIRFTFSMENEDLGRLISYFNEVSKTQCKELICIPDMNDHFEALGILELVKHFNSGLPLVKLKSDCKYPYFIF